MIKPKIIPILATKTDEAKPTLPQTSFAGRPTSSSPVVRQETQMGSTMLT